MPFKFIYAPTFELSDDLSKVEYFGQQDRANEKGLPRHKEHFSHEQKEHRDIFLNAPYILVRSLKTTQSTNDTEAYYIQKYQPKLNIADNNNSERTKNLRLNNDDLKCVMKQEKNAIWYLLPNNENTLFNCLGNISKINERIKRVNKAALVIDKQEDINNYSFNELVEILEKGEIVVKPKIPATLLEPLYSYELNSNKTGIIKYETTYDVFISAENTLIIEEKKSITEKILFKDIRSCDIHEVDLSANFVFAEREYANDNLKKSPDLEDITMKLFIIWKYKMLKLALQLMEIDKDYCKDICIFNLIRNEEGLATYGEGFKYNSLSIINQLHNTYFYKHPINESASLRTSVLFSRREEYRKIINMTLAEFANTYKNQFNDLKNHSFEYAPILKEKDRMWGIC